ncbi:hypothetical protein GGS20DRAFT_554671 [Poronia punctata]|nr:hypothetical protein GGS20DRAFT_554671 [Poronia punctata]
METDPTLSVPEPVPVPISGATLFKLEIERRQSLYRRGCIATGCPGIDDNVLLGGGFERECVVGVSAEDVNFGVLLGLQTVARALVFGNGNAPNRDSSQGNKPKVVVVTTLPTTGILPILRDVIRAQAQSKLGLGNPAVAGELRKCLEAISISRVFDIEGLWEVLHELEPTPEANERKEGKKREGTVVDSDQREELPSRVKSSIEAETDGKDDKDSSGVKSPVKLQPSPERTPSSSSGPVTSLPPLRISTQIRPMPRKTEIRDSEDEDEEEEEDGEEGPELSSSPLSSIDSATFAALSRSPSATGHIEDTEGDGEDPLPAIIPTVDINPAAAAAASVPVPDPTPEPNTQDTKPDNNTSSPPSKEDTDTDTDTDTKPTTSPPDIIIITHFSALLTTLFTNRTKSSAHTDLQLLSLHLRDLARTSGTLIMLLNSTTSPSPRRGEKEQEGNHPQPNNNNNNNNNHHPPTKNQTPLPTGKHPDPTLRSIFNHAPGVGRGGGYYPAGAGGTTSSRGGQQQYKKPSFGAVFAQFLDLHILCTRVPRTREDAEAAVTPGMKDVVRYAWVVEVLLDELGAWKGEEVMMMMLMDNDGVVERPPSRPNREQRWTPVDVRGGVRIVDSFPGGRGG